MKIAGRKTTIKVRTMAMKGTTWRERNKRGN
jgi:hypothetical protein